MCVQQSSFCFDLRVLLVFTLHFHFLKCGHFAKISRWFHGVNVIKLMGLWNGGIIQHSVAPRAGNVIK